MPQHDSVTAPPEDDELTNEEAHIVEGIAKILAEHLYAQPNMTSEQDEADDCSEWGPTSEENKRIFRSAAIEVYRYEKRRRT